MNSWQVTSTETVSFSTHFGLSRPDPPPSRAKSAQTKTLTPAEKISAKTLHQLEHLDLASWEAELPYNLQWSEMTLSNYGPELRDHPSANVYWNIESIKDEIPEFITSENDTRAYVEKSVIRPALVASICLYELRQSLPPSRYPKGNWKIVDSSIVGSTGRVDAIVVNVASELKVAGVEFKTKRVLTSRSSTSQQVSVLGMIGSWISPGTSANMHPDANEAGKGADDGNDSSSGLVFYKESWKKKLQTVIFQVNPDLCSAFSINHHSIDYTFVHI
jgi:hypothetical protein